MKIKLGFTMAEAILVMTILGIIATIMISTLKPAEFKEKGMQIMAKKVLSEIDVATTQILMNNTADGTFDQIYEVGTSNIFNGSAPFFNTASEKLANLYKAYLTTLRTRPNSTHFGSSFLLKDGASISVYCDIGLLGCYTIFPGETELNNTDPCPYGSIFFDINDGDPPNVYGKDKFILPLGKYGIEYAN